MKKIITLLCIAALFVCSLGLVSCGEKDYEIGVGIYTGANVENADGNTDGVASVTYTFAAVVIDSDGKIVDCELDSSYYGDVQVTSAGVCTISKAMTTKQALGSDYGMSAAGKNEWNEQADSFASVTVGKNLNEIKALVASDYRGTEEVINAGCTIYVSDFVHAIEKAFSNTKSVKLSDTDVNLGVAVSSSETDADGDTNGSASFTATVTAAVMNGDKVSACLTDEAVVELEVTSDGAVEGNDSEYKTKREQGNSYGMSSIGKTEWYAQVDAFDNACEGKTADEIAALTVSSGANYGYAVEDVQTAGCTIYAGNLSKAASKAATVSE